METQSVTLEAARRTVGSPTKTVESLKLLRGLGGFADDHEFADQYYAMILRSPYAHAKIKSLDLTKAMALPGVILAVGGDEVARRTKPMTSRAATKSPDTHYIMAKGKVRYHGEPVAAVVARDRYLAADALDLIEVEYEPLPAVTSIDQALGEGAPLIYEELGSNLVIDDEFDFGDFRRAEAEADVVVQERMSIQRYSSTPLECYVVNSYFDRTKDELTIYATDQQPGRTVYGVASTLGLDPHNVRLVVPNVGGGFGIKLAVWQYVALVSLLSIMSGKPVKWVQTRMESLYGPHRPAGYMDAKFALKSDGSILGMDLTEYVGDGNWPFVAGLYSLIKFSNMVGCYRVRNVKFRYKSVATNMPPVVQDRGVGKPFMTFVLERMVDLSARRLKMDPAKFRLKNMIRPKEMPYTTPSGEVYESGNYPAALQKAMETIGYDDMKRRQAEMRKGNRYIGIGLVTGVEPGTSNLGYYYLSRATPDFMGAGGMATVEADGNGRIKAWTAASEIGTGHSTTTAQVLADIFDMGPEEISVDSVFDSGQGFLGYSGTYSNAFNDVYLGAVVRAGKKLKAKMLRIAGNALRTPVEDLRMKDRRISSVSDQSKTVTFEEVAAMAYKRLLQLPPDEEPGLRVQASYQSPFAKPPNKREFNVQLTHSNSVHACVVEVDVETGKITFDKYVIVHDSGNVVNPKIVEGMAIGSTMSGIGGAIFEEFGFDENGSNMSLTFGEYLKPTTTETPEMQVCPMQTPSPTSPLGTKAAGEGGAITAPAAVASAVEDALSPFGAKVLRLPLSPENVLNLIRGSRH